MNDKEKIEETIRQIDETLEDIQKRTKTTVQLTTDLENMRKTLEK
jgi:hypothetical protein